jgi:hypothetical protein
MALVMAPAKRATRELPARFVVAEAGKGSFDYVVVRKANDNCAQDDTPYYVDIDLNKETF